MPAVAFVEEESVPVVEDAAVAAVVVDAAVTVVITFLFSLSLQKRLFSNSMINKYRLSLGDSLF
jgi:hypothetical protein